MAKKFIGILKLGLDQGEYSRVSVYKDGNSITLTDIQGSFIVHPQNEREENGWMSEYKKVRKIKVESHEFIPTHLIKSSK